MKEQSENRRVRMTKRLMKDALMDLLERTELSGISVTALCEAADVNRSTFYSYYASPADLLREIEQEVLDRIPAPAAPQNRRGEESLLRTTEAFFDFVRENERVFRMLNAAVYRERHCRHAVGVDQRGLPGQQPRNREEDVLLFQKTHRLSTNASARVRISDSFRRN